MSGHEKSRAVVLAALMVLSVVATGLAFTGGAAAAPGDNAPPSRTGNLQFTITPGTITPGTSSDMVTVDITNPDANDSSYDYTVTNGLTGEDARSGTTTNTEFSFSLNPDRETKYRVRVTPNNDDDDNNDGGSSTLLTAAYDLSISPSEVAVNDDMSQQVTGVLKNDQGEGVDSQVVYINDPSGQQQAQDVSGDNGQINLQFIPNDVGTWPVKGQTDNLGADFSNRTFKYTNFEVNANELTVTANESTLLAGNNQSVDFTVSQDGNQLTGDDLSSLDFAITQGGDGDNNDDNDADVSTGDGDAEMGKFVDTDGDGNVDTYRTGIDADQSASLPVNVTVMSDGGDDVGTTSLDVVAPQVNVDATSPGTKGVRTPVTISVTDPRDGSALPGSADVRIAPDHGVLEIHSDGEADITDQSSDDGSSIQTSDGGNSLELDSRNNQSVTFHEAGGDSDGEFNINGTVYAYNATGNLNESVLVNYDARLNDEAGDGDTTEDSPYGDAGSAMFERLNGEASPDSIPLQGDSLIDVTTTDAQNNSLDRMAYLDGAGVDVNGPTGDDGQTTFSVNPSQTGTINLDVGYDDDFVGSNDGGSDAPDQVMTDSVDVTNGGGGQGNIDVSGDTSFGDVTVGNSKSQTVTLTNTGNAPVTVTGTTVRGQNNDAFGVIGNSAGLPGDGNGDFTLAPGETHDLTVRFAPNSADDKSATLRVTRGDGETVDTPLTGSGVAQPHATVDFNDQISSDGQTVTVDSVYLPNDGYVAIHNATQLNNGQVQQSVIGVSDYLSSGTHDDVQVTLFDVPGKNYPDDKTLDDGDQTLVAMPHKETNGNQQYNFITSNGNQDGPYTDDNGAVVDAGVVTYNAPQPPANGGADHVITVRGAGGSASYQLSVSADLEKSTANGASINRNDDLRRGYVASGAVGAGGADSYTYNGSLETLKASGNAVVSIDGNQLNRKQIHDMPSNVVEVAGSGPFTSYHLSSNGAVLQKTTANGASLNANDDIFRTTANGGVGPGGDAYGYNGRLDSLKVTGDATLYVNGVARNPAKTQSHVVTVVGSGDFTRYSFSATNDLKKSTANYASFNPNDVVSGDSVHGSVGNGADSFVYNGRLSNLNVDGDATVYLDGHVVDQDQVGS